MALVDCLHFTGLNTFSYYFSGYFRHANYCVICSGSDKRWLAAAAALGSVDDHCKQGLKESETCCDVERQAEFLYCGAVLHILSGNAIEKSITILKVRMKVKYSKA
jgi:hypothetical protein